MKKNHPLPSELSTADQHAASIINIVKVFVFAAIAILILFLKSSTAA